MVSDDYVRALDEVTSSIVKIKAHHSDGSTSIGTGFLVHIEGYIVTAYHVVKGAVSIEVIPEKWPHSIEAVLHSSNTDDMAFLKINFKGLDVNYKARFGIANICPRNKHVSVAGAEVGLVGYAWGMDDTVYSTLFAFRRNIALNIMHPEHGKGLFYYIDGTAIAGMSGGPVFDYKVGVVGVITRIQPEKFIRIGDGANNKFVPSAEHLTIALQSFYIHMGLEHSGIYL